jgi:hypothetical protein
MFVQNSSDLIEMDQTAGRVFFMATDSSSKIAIPKPIFCVRRPTQFQP